MRHKAQVARFSRTFNHRKAMIRNLVGSLVLNGRITTTVAKAKELRRHAERAVTMARGGTLNARRILLSRYPNKEVVEHLMANLGPAFKDRNGGYTRILKTNNRPGDNAEMALIEWVNHVFTPKASETDSSEPGKKEKTAAKKPAKAGAKKAKKAK
jgi:large subunit ribosomal protein L17